MPKPTCPRSQARGCWRQILDQPSLARAGAVTGAATSILLVDIGWQCTAVMLLLMAAGLVMSRASYGSQSGIEPHLAVSQPSWSRYIAP